MEMPYRIGINKNSDDALVAAAKRGDTQAFEELVCRHTRRVLAAVRRITNNREDAEDVTQESFHKAFLHIHTFREKARFSTWLMRIAMNEAFILLRRKRGVFEVLPENPDDGEKLSPELFVDLRPNPEESCSRNERTQLLTEGINRLSPAVRTAILLRFIEERSAKETAQILGASITAVKSRVFHGRRNLRRALNAGSLRGSRQPLSGRQSAVNA
jgi:RNA polymerase sigma-70 factor, ECF subfamily